MADLDPDRERQRQAELNALELDTFAETAFDDLTRAAAQTLQAPIATITIVDGAWQWFKSKIGLAEERLPRAEGFCDYAIRAPEAFFVVEDATQDPRFAHHPLVAGKPHIRFYAAAPLRLSSGRAIGTVEVMDYTPHRPDRAKLERLKFLADQVVATLEARQAKKRSARSGD
jgi:GAF domain-containing protein